MAGYGVVCLTLLWGVLQLRIPYSTVVLLAAPLLIASAWFDRRVYLAMAPLAAATALAAILLRAPDLREALTALAGLGVTVLGASETVFQLGRRQRATQEQLRRRAGLLDALHATATALLEGAHAHGLLETLLARACQLLDTPHGNLFLVEGDRLRCRIARGGTRWMQEEGLEVAPGQGISGYVWETGRPVVVQGYGAWQRRLPDPRLDFVQHAAAMPLRVHGRVMGVIVVVRAEADRPFSSEEVEVVERFAELASVVVQNATLYQAAQEELRRRRQAEAELVHKHELVRTLHATMEELLSGSEFESLLAAVVDRACALLRSTHGNLYLREGETMRCVVGVGAAGWAQQQWVRLRMGEGMVGRVWESGQLLAVEDYASWPGRLPFPQVDCLGPALTVPLQVSSEVVGALFVARSRGSSPYAPEEREVARRFGHLASLVLYQASMRREAQEELARRRDAEDQLRRRQELLQALYSTMEALLAGLSDPDALLQTLVDQACTLLSSPHGILYVVEGDALHCRAAAGAMAWAAEQRLVIGKGQGLTGRVWETQRTAVVEDYATWPGRLPHSGFDQMGPAVCVPLRSADRFVGAFSVARDRSAPPFSAEEIETVERFGQLASLVLHNAQAVQAIEEQRAFYEEVLDHVPSDIAVLDSQFRYLYANPSAIRDPELRRWLVGRDDFELCRRTGHDPSVAEVRRQHLRQALRERRTVEFEEKLQGRDGKERYFLRRVHPVVDRAGRVTRLIGYGVNITDRKRAELRLAQLALHDPLTGLPNRTLLMDRLRHAWERAQRTGAQMAVLFVDLDRFKVVNDTLGHEAGDSLMQQVADRLRSCLRSSDTLARLAGDEFVVLLEDLGDGEDPQKVAERIRLVLEPPFSVAGQEFSITASVGIARSGPQTRRVEDLLRQSDTAMYRAKALGRNRHEVFQETSNGAPDLQVPLSAEVGRALERGEFVLYFQPVVRLADRRTVEMEALVRWRHPTRGLLLPAHFLEILETNGLRVPFQEWVLHEACRAARRWQDLLGTRAPAVSVNLSGSQLLDPRLPERVLRALGSWGLQPTALRLEVSERTLAGLGQDGQKRLRSLEQLPLILHLDDLPTTFSVESLRDLPVRWIKLDRAWFAGWSDRSVQKLEALFEAARELGLELVAKGVEDPRCLEKLSELGCAYAQGYLLGEPMDLEASDRFLVAGS